jgi:hypothetical protein
VADIFDTLQPYLRGDAFRDDPLWQLNELWTMDKHRGIPMNSNFVKIAFPVSGWERNTFYSPQYGLEVHFPLVQFCTSEVDIKPTVTVEILFGEYMGDFVVSRARLGEINDFVRNEAIPRFARFFPQRPRAGEIGVVNFLGH